MYLTSYQRAVFPIALDKIFPAGYRYQLGFVNREELFMYDATAGNGDTSSDPTISRFYASAVGHFGYATQYSRLNRRSMQGYHLSTSSQFLGDHLARFSSTPAAGVHTPSELTDVFGHTPVEQGATGTNYGSYAEGYYNLTTTAGSETGGNWRSVSYTGTLRGYVLELRTNPVEQHYREEKTEHRRLGRSCPVMPTPLPTGEWQKLAHHPKPLRRHPPRRRLLTGAPAFQPALPHTRAPGTGGVARVRRLSSRLGGQGDTGRAPGAHGRVWARRLSSRPGTGAPTF